MTRWLTLALAVATLACSNQPPAADGPSSGDAALDARIARFAPVDLTVDISALPGNEPGALARIIRAARLMDGLFLEQVWAGNPSLLAQLSADPSPIGRARLRYFLINKGPWSRLDHNEAFLGPEFGVPAKPGGANYYPADAKKEEIEKWFQGLSGDAKQAATGFFTLVRRSPAGLMLVPYNTAYANVLHEAATHLLAAADMTSQPTLKRYLELRAKAFLNNDYYESDIAWMELNASIEPTIGPYETYEDEWFSFKAAFEAFVTLRDDAETKRLAVFGAELQALENELPIDPKLRNPQLGSLAPIRVVNVIFTAGDANRGVQTAAFNLPNDERVVTQKGSKRVMLKNVQEAKFQKVLVPIAQVALNATDRAKVSFEAFFTHILMHELMHGLGPQTVQPGGLGIRQYLKDTSSAIEEAKADISGLWAMRQLADRAVVSPTVAQSMYTTFLASAFRSIRFGINEAHGKGIALQLNYLLDKGGFVVNADGTFTVNDNTIRDAVASLTTELMTIQAKGDYAAAQALLKQYVSIRPDVQRVLDKLKDVPVDIAPRFVTADALLKR